MLHVSGMGLCLENPPAALKDSRRVQLGIRPEHVRLSRTKSLDAWPTSVTLVVLHGNQSYLELRLGTLELTAVVQASTNFEVGENVYVQLPAEKVHLFDAETGDRIS